jgi:hypothetical protein
LAPHALHLAPLGDTYLSTLSDFAFAYVFVFAFLWLMLLVS